MEYFGTLPGGGRSTNSATQSNAISHPYQHADANPFTHRDSHPYSNAHAHSNANPHPDPDIWSFTYPAAADCDQNPGSCANTFPNEDSLANSHTTDTHPHENPLAYRNSSHKYSNHHPPAICNTVIDSTVDMAFPIFNPMKEI